MENCPHTDSIPPFLNVVQVSNELESERSVKSFVESKNEEEESITHSIKKWGKNSRVEEEWRVVTFFQ